VRILVIEDEELLANAVARGLRRQGMAVDVAADGGRGIRKLDVNTYDVVVLDRDLPVLHGDDVCRDLMARPDPPRVLMLTASGGVEDRVEGLSIGADDYLGKPFAFAELVARIERWPAGPRPPGAPS
jgi:DNA-binding response OmpR family regulator